MSKKRDASSDDEFDPFDDLLSDDDFDNSSPLKVEDDDDILKLANEDDDDLLDEIERRGRPRRTGGGGLDIGALIGGLIRVILTAILAVVVFLLIGAGVVIGGRAVGVIPGGSIDLTNISISSLSVPTQPPAPEPTSVEVAQVPTDAAPTIQPTSEIQLPTFAPTPTPVPECNQSEIDAWWGQQEGIYNRFSAITPATVSSEQNINGYLEQLRLQREYSAAVVTGPCTEFAQQSLIRYLDATMDRVRALTAAPGTSEDALPSAERALDAAAVTMTAALWDTNILVEEESPVAYGIERGSAETCGASLWLAQVETIYNQFMGAAGQINVAVLSPTAVRDLINNMQNSMNNVANLTVPECAAVPSQLLQQAMQNRISASENLLAARTETANAELAEAERLEARYQAWVVWLRG